MDADSETAPALINVHAESEDEDDGHEYPVINDSIRAITAFMKSDVRKYNLDIKLEPLRDEPYGYNDSEQYDVWKAGMDVLFELHQVLPVVRGTIQRLPEKGETCIHIRNCYPRLAQWRMHEARMHSVAVALIYANVEEKIRANGIFIEDLAESNPEFIMTGLDVMYGPDFDDEDEDEYVEKPDSVEV